MRKTISIDFDGVIHLGDDNWIAPGIVAGRVNPDALCFMLAALESGWDVAVHSCRFYDLGAVDRVRTWIVAQAEDQFGSYIAEQLGSRLQFMLTKPRARIYIDDRGFHYTPARGFPQLADIT